MTVPSGIIWTPGDESPPAPPAGKFLIYQKPDGSLWYKRPDGSEAAFIQTVRYPKIINLYTRSNISFSVRPVLDIPWNGTYYESPESPFRWANNDSVIRLTALGVYRISYKVVIRNYASNRINLRTYIVNENDGVLRGSYSYGYARYRNYVAYAAATMADLILPINRLDDPFSAIKLRADISYNDTSFGDARDARIIPMDTWISITYQPGA